MMKVVTVDEINKLGMRLRTTDGKPAIEKPNDPPPAPRNEVAEAMALVAEAIKGMKQPEPVSIDPLIDTLTDMLRQNKQLLNVVKAALEPEVVEPAPPQEWDFKVEYDGYGRIKSIKAKECK